MQVATSSHWFEPNIESCGPILPAQTSVGIAIGLLQAQPDGCLWVGRVTDDQANAPHASQIQGYVTACQLLAVIATPTQGNPLDQSLGTIARPSPTLSIDPASPTPAITTALLGLAENNARRFLVVDEQQYILGQLSREALQQAVIDQLMLQEQGSLAPAPPSTQPQDLPPTETALATPSQAPTQLSPQVQPALQTALDQLSQALQALEVHGQAESKLQHRIDFEALLTQISTQFLNLQDGEIAPALHQALAHTATFTHCDRACIFLYSDDGQAAHCHHEWNRDDLIPFTKPLRTILRRTFPWSLEQMRQQQLIHVPDVALLPPEAAPEQEAAQQLQAQSYVVVPIQFQGQPLGWLAFYAVHQPKTWATADLQQLETLSSIIAGVIVRQQAAVALEESEARFAQLAENLDQVFFIYQADPYKLLYISPAYENIWGLSSAALYEDPDHWHSTVHPQDYERVMREMKRRRKEGISIDLEYRIFHPAGDERWIRSRSFPLRDATGKIYRLAGIAEDVSDRHHYEAALARSEEKFASAFRLNPMPMGITLLEEARYLEVNDAFCEYSGFRREELVGQSLWDLDLIVDQGQYQAIHKTLVERGGFENMELHIRDRQGRIRISQISGICIDVEGQARILSISRDITEQRQRETQRQQMEQALRKASQAAEAANKAKGELLAMVSHEIRTPLSAILSMSNLLLEGGLSPQQQEHMEILRSGGQQLLSILDDVLDFSRLDASQITIELAAFDLANCIQEVQNLFLPQARSKGLRLRAELSPQLNNKMVSDQHRLKQILNNLLGNAIKFSPQGEIVLTVHPGERDKDELIFSLRDQGVGISQAGLDKLFEPFSQANASIARRYGGSGLGLTICDRIVRRLGGRIWVESGGNLGGNPPEGWAMRQTKPNPASNTSTSETPTSNTSTSNIPILEKPISARPAPDLPVSNGPVTDNQGSHFYFTLPRVLSSPTPAPSPRQTPSTDVISSDAISTDAISASPASHQPPAASPLPPSSIKILLVEDNELNQRVARLILQRMGYEADLASSGETAIAAIKKQSYDLILLDLNLPQINGYQLYQVVQALPQIPWVIVMSAAVEPESRDRCISLGMNDFVPKPIEREELTAAFSRFWQQRNAHSLTDSEAPKSHAPTLELPVFNEIRQLCKTDSHFQQLLLTYQDDAALQLQAMVQAQANQDGLALFDMLHSLRPATASLGGARLAELCNGLEQQLREHGFYRLEPEQKLATSPMDWTAIAAHLQVIETEYQRLIEAMKFQAWDIAEI